ncbi:MAG: hypothetical protein EOM05_07130 [Clostridia bacterium]|nr:hypothetical protein [Clostridia bacterium]
MVVLTLVNTYDANGNLQTVTAPNGVLTTLTYDNADMVQSLLMIVQISS